MVGRLSGLKQIWCVSLRLAVLVLWAFCGHILVASSAYATGATPPGWIGYGLTQYYGTPGAACSATWSGMKSGAISGDIGPDSTFGGARPHKGGYVCDWTTFQRYCQYEEGSKICGTTLPAGIFFECPAGQYAIGQGVCSGDVAVDPPTNSCNTAGNPILIPTGDKIETAVDFTTADSRLSVTRLYRSLPMRHTFDFVPLAQNGPILGELNGWSFSFALEWHISDYIADGKGGQLYIPDGTSWTYMRTGGTFVPRSDSPNSDYKVEFVGTAPANWATAINTASQWRVTELGSGRVWLLQTFAEEYNAAPLRYSIARPIKITDVDGYVQNLTYGSMGELSSINDSYGRSLGVSWNYRKLTDVATIPLTNPVPTSVKQITLPDGNRLVYAYDPPPSSVPLALYPERLVTVHVKNSAQVNIETTGYHYEDTRFPNFLTGITDNRGVRYSTFAYDNEGRATSSEHSGGVGRTTVSYSKVGTDFVRTVVNPLGKTSKYTYGYASSGNFILALKSLTGDASANCPASNATLFNNEEGHVTSHIDEEDRLTMFTRDTLNRPLSVTRGAITPQAVTTSYVWNSAWSTPVQVINPGLTIDYTRNAAGQLTLVKATDTTTQTAPYSTSGQIRQTAYSYSATGQLLTVDGPLAGAGDTVTYTYNTAGYLKTITNEVGHLTTVNTVNGRGQPTRVTDPNGVITDMVWDDLGRLTSVNVAPGVGQALTSFTYNGAGDVLTVTRPGGVVLSMAYDTARRLTSITNGSGESITYTRDLMDNITKTEVRAGTTIKAQRNQVFDELGRLIRTVGANSSQTWAFGYDKTGNNTSVTDPRSKVWAYGFDVLNRLTSETEPGTGAITLTRNGTDAVTSYTDRRNLVTTYVRNGFGDVIRESNPDTGVSDYTYDARGLVTQIKDARLVIANMAYDNAGRIVSRSFPAAATENVIFTYDSMAAGNKGRGRLTQLNDPVGRSKFVYDVRGNLISETRTIGVVDYLVSYTYDNADRLLTITYPSGRIITYVRNVQGKITGVTAKANASAAAITLASDVRWQPFGGEKVFGQGSLDTATQAQALPGEGGLGNVDLLQSVRYGNNLLLWKKFTLDHELSGLYVGDGALTLLNGTLARGDKTNITQISNLVTPSDSQTLTYTDAARLSGASTGAGSYGTRLWSYDNNGNCTSETANGVTNTYAYPANSNRLSTVKQGATTTRAFTYDAAGNTTQDLRGATAYNYAVNNAGRIKSLTVGTALKATYAYDGFQKLRLKNTTAPAASTTYVWDSFGHIIAEHNFTGGGALKEYIWLGDTPLAVFDGVNLFYVHPDHLDRPVMMTNAAAQTVAWAAKYDPFGNPVTVTVAPVNNQRLPGQWFQHEDGLAYNWHRTYDASLGRYSQADPLGFVDGPSVYSYIKSSPLMGVDLSGLHKGDKWFGYNDREFQRWFHLCWKERGDPDADKDGIEEAYAEWKRRGSPAGGRCYGNPPISEPAPSQSPVCGPGCATGIVVLGVCCVLAPEVCIPGLLLGGAAASN